MRKLPPAFLIPLSEVKRDTALRSGSRGARKHLVTSLYETAETTASSVTWVASEPPTKTYVQVMSGTEVGVFNEQAQQDRHYHAQGTEIYEVIEGEMRIEVEAVDYVLRVGDMIVINPHSVHEVKPDGSQFLCRVINVNCGGPSDKYVL